MTTRPTLAALLALLLLCLSPAPARAETYRDNDHQFQIDVPAGWKRTPEADFARFESAASAVGGKNVTYLAVYSKDPAGKVALPYMAIMWVNIPGLDGASTEDLAREFKAETIQQGVSSANKKSGGVISNMTVGRTVLDVPNNRLVANMDAQIGGGGTMRANLISYFGRDGLAQFVMYSKPDQAAADAAQMESMLATFRFDPGRQFVPGAGRGKFNSSQVLIYAAVGAVVGGLIGLVKKLGKR
jgi:hypothetical protein